MSTLTRIAPIGPRLLAACALAALLAGCLAPSVAQRPGDASPSGTSPARTGEAVSGRTPLPLGPDPLRLVALGDSYTLGARVRRQDAWPSRLVRALEERVPLQLVANLAQTGKSSQDVIDEQLWVLSSLQPELVSLQVGVNDVIFPSVTLEDYRANIRLILDELLVHLPPERIFVVTTPDYTLTRHGADYGDPAEQRAAIEEVNRILIEEAVRRGVLAVDISPVSDRVAEDPSLLTADGLHPSAKQYAGWVELIAPRLHAALTGAAPPG